MNHQHEGWLENGALIGGRYRIQALIGKGGMGEVYAAEDVRLHGKIRALKVSRGSAETEMRSMEEAGLLMRLNHPHLPLIVDYFPPEENGGYELMVMEYIDGITLQAYLEAQGGVISAVRVIEIGLQLAEALRYLHSQLPSIIHRDLKPTNVMIDRSGFVRLIDFGIAREFKPGQTRDTVTLGTPGFAAPEQEGACQSDARTDVFGLGALLHYLLVGGMQNPRAASGRMQATQGRLGSSPALTSVIARMTDPIPACRFATMEETRKALERCLYEHAGNGPGAEADNIASRMTSHQSALARRQPVLARRQAILVASLSPGAGGTFIAITLAHLLDRPEGPAVAAVEHPVLEPEWHALLPATGKGRHADKPTADHRYRRTTSSSARLDWYRLDPTSPSDAVDQDAEPGLRHRLMLQAIDAPIVITDVSSHWLSPDIQDQLVLCDKLLFVVDPFPSKWTPQRLAAARRICFEREHAGRSTYWIANKDGKFSARSEWLASMPSKPCCSVPMLPGEEWADQMWSGDWATANRSWQPMLERALHPVLRAISGSW